MEDKLRNLKKELDDTVFKNIPFNRNESIKSVLEGGARKKTYSKNYLYIFKKWFPEFVSVIVCTTILFSLIKVGVDNYSGSQYENMKENQTESLNSKENDTTHVPMPNKEEQKELSKEEILTKMFSTFHHFDTAKGEFELHYDGGDEPVDVTVQYELSLKDNGGVYREFNDEISDLYYYQNDKLWRLHEKEKYYAIIPHSSSIENSEEDKKSIDIDQYGDITVLSKPSIPPVGIAKESLFPYEMMENYIDNINDITIENQNEALLGHNTIVMMAKINNRSIKTMRFWVDKDTGILVKYETYNSVGEIVDYLSPTKLEINVPVDKQKFIPNLEGYTDAELHRQKQPQMTTGNIDELVPEELKSQWEEAKKKPNETTLLHLDDKWYIFAKKGYLVNYIEVNGTEGTLYLSKTPPQKSQYTFHALAEGYKVDTLEIVYE